MNSRKWLVVVCAFCLLALSWYTYNVVSSAKKGTNHGSYVYDNPVEAQKVLKAKPNDAKALRSMFVYYSKKGEFDKDIIYLKRIADQKDGERIFKFTYAQRLVETKKRENVTHGFSLLRDLSKGNDDVAGVAQKQVSNFDEQVHTAIENAKVIRSNAAH